MKRSAVAACLLSASLAALAAAPAWAQQVDPISVEGDELEGAPNLALSPQPATAPSELMPVSAPTPPAAPSIPPETPATPPQSAAEPPPIPPATPLPPATSLDVAVAPIVEPPPPGGVDRLLAGEKACAGCLLADADLSYRDFPNQDLTGATLAGADLSLTTFDKARFTGASLAAINGFGMRAMSADFSGADLSDATLVGTWLGGSRFAGANLARANLGGANMARTTGLTQAQLNQACGDAWTVLPAGLTVPACIVAG